jgi:hypothetical protein
MIRFQMITLTGFLALTVGLTGCNKDEPTAKAPPAQTQVTGEATDDVAIERAKLIPEDRELVEAQEWCVISTDERLGSMGPPLKLDIKGQPVFICCKGCKRKAEADPDKTLAKVEELKAKAKAEREPKK